jgi:hypothetical protein
MNLADIEAQAATTLHARKLAAEADNKTTEKLVIAKLLKFLEEHPRINNIYMEMHSEYNDEGGSYLYASYTVYDKDENELDSFEEFDYEAGFGGADSCVIETVFGGWEGSLTRQELVAKAEAQGITI